MTTNTIAKPRIREVKVIVSRVTKKSMFLRAGYFGFKIVRKKEAYLMALAKYNPFTDSLEPPCKFRFSNVNELVRGLEGCLQGSEIDPKPLGEAIYGHISHWGDYLTQEELLSIFRAGVPPLEGGISIGWDNAGGTIKNKYIDLFKNIDLSKISYKELRGIIEKVFNSKLADMLESVLSCILTLKQVDRGRGIYSNRPVWEVIVAPPSAYKTTVLNLLRKSKYTFFANQFTAASLLSAKPEVHPLIEFIHGRGFIIPTLTEVASERERARKVFAALESVYDGYYSKGTGYSGFMEREVDTVVIAAVTPAIWIDLVEYLQNIGNRWLVYQLKLDDDDGLAIQDRLERYHGITEALTPIVSLFLDNLFQSVDYKLLNTIQLTTPQISDLKILAKVIARLRASTRIMTYWEERDGRNVPVKELEVIQREVPGRAFNSLRNFVKANTIVRGSTVNRAIGLPVVSKESMKLAFQLALGSTDPHLSEIYLYLVKNIDRETPPSLREIARAIGLSKSTVERKLKALKHPNIELIDEDNYPTEEYAKVVLKYLKEEESNE